MNKNNENKLIPRLRFPEFQHSGEWEVKKLGEVFDFQEGFPFSSRDLTDNKENAKQVVRITEINNHNKNAEKVYVPNNKIEELSIEYYKVTKGDLLLSLTGAAGFNFFIWNGEEAYLNQRNVKFIPKDKINKAILFLIEPLIHKKINLMGTGQNNNLSKEALKDVLLLIPKLPEQQKIASCLSSLDEVIAGERQKLTLLQQHKKGLLQQLFPQEGETVPRFRFPEFSNEENWKICDLIDTADKKVRWSFTGGPFGSNLKATDYTENGIRVIQLQNIGDGVFLDNYKIYTSEGKADELISCNIYSGEIIISKMGDPVGRACIIPDHLGRCVMASDGIRLVVDEKRYSNFFIYSLINSKQIRDAIEKKSTGSTRKRIGLDELRHIQLPIPPSLDEQQKIASCLSSLDDIITAQTQKIELLEQHKKGLLQGLFPMENE